MPEADALRDVLAARRRPDPADRSAHDLVAEGNALARARQWWQVRGVPARRFKRSLDDIMERVDARHTTWAMTPFHIDDDDDAEPLMSTTYDDADVLHRWQAHALLAMYRDAGFTADLLPARAAFGGDPTALPPAYVDALDRATLAQQMTIVVSWGATSS